MNGQQLGKRNFSKPLNCFLMFFVSFFFFRGFGKLEQFFGKQSQNNLFNFLLLSLITTNSKLRPFNQRYPSCTLFTRWFITALMLFLVFLFVLFFFFFFFFFLRFFIFFFFFFFFFFSISDSRFFNLYFYNFLLIPHFSLILIIHQSPPSAIFIGSTINCTFYTIFSIPHLKKKNTRNSNFATKTTKDNPWQLKIVKLLKP